MNTIYLSNNFKDNNVLNKLINKSPELKPLQKYKDKNKLIKNLKEDNLKTETILIDINDKKEAPVCLAKKIKEIDSRIRIVLIMDKRNKAAEAFAVDVEDYLLKPFSRKRFKKTIRRLKREKI